MIFKYDKTTLSYQKITSKVVVYSALVVLLISGIMSFFTLRHINDVKFISEETRAIILKDADKENEFSREKLNHYRGDNAQQSQQPR